MRRIAMTDMSPEQAREQKIADEELKERDRQSQVRARMGLNQDPLPFRPGNFPDGVVQWTVGPRGPNPSGRGEVRMRRIAEMNREQGPPEPPGPIVPGSVAGPGAEDEITDAQVVQFLSRLPYRRAGRGPGEALEGVRVRTPEEREAAARRAEEAAQAIGATKPDPVEDTFGEARPPMDRALAAEQADREKTRAAMQADIDARRRGDDAARAAGFTGMQDRQDRTLESKTVGGRNILRGQWVDTQAARYGIPPEEFDAMYEQFGQGKTHKETIQAIVASGVLRELRSAKNYPGAKPSLADRNAAVQANAKQYNEARKLTGPQGRAFLANSIMGAQTPEDLERVMAAAHAVDPRGGWDRLAENKAGALAEGEAPERGPMERMAEDRARIEQQPLGPQRIAGYRDMYRAQVPPGQPAQPDQENAFIVNNGAQGASQAAQAAVTGNQDPDAMAYLQEWTNAFVASGVGSGRTAYDSWIRRLGIPKSEESMALWQKMTGVNPRGWGEWAAEGMGFNWVPSQAEATGQPPK